MLCLFQEALLIETVELMAPALKVGSVTLLIVREFVLNEKKQ